MINLKNEINKLTPSINPLGVYINKDDALKLVKLYQRQLRREINCDRVRKDACNTPNATLSYISEIIKESE